MLIVTFHDWAGFRVSRGLWNAWTLGFCTAEVLPGGDLVANVVAALAVMRGRKR